MKGLRNCKVYHALLVQRVRRMLIYFQAKRIEYIRVEFTRKKCKTAILLYCFHTAGVLHIFTLNNLLDPGTSFYRKLAKLHSNIFSFLYVYKETVFFTIK